MTTRKSITITYITKDKNDPYSFGGPYGEDKYDAEGNCTSITMSANVQGEDTAGDESKSEYKKGHADPESVAKIVTAYLKGGTGKKSIIFKSLGIEASK